MLHTHRGLLLKVFICIDICICMSSSCSLHMICVYTYIYTRPLTSVTAEVIQLLGNPLRGCTVPRRSPIASSIHRSTSALRAKWYVVDAKYSDHALIPACACFPLDFMADVRNYMCSTNPMARGLPSSGIHLSQEARRNPAMHGMLEHIS